MFSNLSACVLAVPAYDIVCRLISFFVVCTRQRLDQQWTALRRLGLRVLPPRKCYVHALVTALVISGSTTVVASVVMNPLYVAREIGQSGNRIKLSRA